MRLLRISALVLLVSGSVGWLMADPVDPIIKFTAPIGGSVDITCTTDGCLTSIGFIGENGFGDFPIHNATDQQINELKFFIPTTNFNQPFSVSTNAFLFASITQDISGSQDPTESSTSELIVDYSGVGPGTQGGSAFLFGEGCSSEGSICDQPGFTPGGEVFVESFFGDPPTTNFNGLLPDQHGLLSLSPDVPEPGSFVLLFGAAGILVIKRRFRRA